MGGIAGIVNLHGNNIEPHTINGMLETIAHRGPDMQGSYVDAKVAICSALVNIHNFSGSYTQPLISQDEQHILVFNGEVYNYKELRTEYLSGIGFSSNSDTEVLLRMYIKYGEESLQYLNGMFSLAIYDKQQKKLLCARDRLGIKPFFYYLDDDRFVFASDIKALLCAGIRAEPDYQSIYDYLIHGYVLHTSSTFFRKIRNLRPGHYLSIDIPMGNVKIRSYWDLAKQALRVVGKGEDEFLEEFELLLLDSIKANLQGHVPIGISVSGGFDSCLVSAAVQKVTKNSKEFPLFSYGGGEESYNEFSNAKKLADDLSWPLHLVAVSPEKCIELAQDTIYAEEQPHAGISQIAKYYFYSKLDDYGVKVILSGGGGDSIGGEGRALIGAITLDYIRKFGWEKAYMEFQDYLQREKKHDLDGTIYLMQALNSMYHGKVTADGQSFSFPAGLSEDFLAGNKGHKTIFERPFADQSLNMSYQSLFHTRHNRTMHNNDKASSNSAVEERAPLLDHRLVELAFSVPIEMRMRNGQQRYFMRKVAKKVWPFEGMDSPKVFHLDPQRYWFQTKLANWVMEIISSRSFKERGIFDQKEVIKEFKAYKKRKNPPTSYHIWQFICLELWFRAFVD